MPVGHDGAALCCDADIVKPYFRALRPPAGRQKDAVRLYFIFPAASSNVTNLYRLQALCGEQKFHASFC